MARKTEQGGGKPDEAPHDRAPGIETRLAKPGYALPPIVPPGDRLGDSVHLQRIEPERFPDVAQRALGLISDERGRQPSALTAVFVIDVLDDFLAPLVLEIDVDIGRLVALLRNEALEQQLLLDRIDLGEDRKSTRLNSSHLVISYAVFCLKKKKIRYTMSCYKL